MDLSKYHYPELPEGWRWDIRERRNDINLVAPRPDDTDELVAWAHIQRTGLAETYLSRLYVATSVFLGYLPVQDAINVMYHRSLLGGMEDGERDAPYGTT